jgi:hypothetical protein
MSNLIPITELERMAISVAKSGLFGIKTPDQAMALMLIAQAEGLHPAIAARDYHVIQGRPALKADAMLARFQTAGGKVRWTEYTDKRVAGMFSHPSGGEVEIDWTIEKARSLGFLSKDNWKNYPRAMMRARCISEGIRTVFPGCVVGVYTPEEVEDFDAPKPMRDMGPAEVVEMPATPTMEEGAVIDHISAIESAATMEDLESAFKKSYVAAFRLNDKQAIARLIEAKDRRKLALQEAA